MKKQRKKFDDLPIGWPKNIPLPTMGEAEKAVRTVEKEMSEIMNEFQKGVKGVSQEMLDTQITI